MRSGSGAWFKWAEALPATRARSLLSIPVVRRVQVAYSPSTQEDSVSKAEGFVIKN